MQLLEKNGEFSKFDCWTAPVVHYCHRSINPSKLGSRAMKKGTLAFGYFNKLFWTLITHCLEYGKHVF